MQNDANHRFVGSIPENYERHLVPLIFQPYADDLARRVVEFSPAEVLEIACGTGVVTRSLADRLGSDAHLTATDLNVAMLDVAKAIGLNRAVTWTPADAQDLPFADESFDAVVCQFGVMFLPDRLRGYSEMRRVLRPGGVLVFNAWDRIERNQLAHCVNGAVGALFPDGASPFMARVPHGYFDAEEIRSNLRAAGFVGAPTIALVEARSRGPHAQSVALGFCQGTPFRHEIEARDIDVDHATEVARLAVTDVFGPGDIDAAMAALIVVQQK